MTVSLLYDIYLILKIRYGNVLITKITLRPYYYALAYLVCSFLFNLMRCHFNDTATNLNDNLNVWNNADQNWLIAAMRVLDACSLIFFIYFIASRTHKVALLH